MKQKVLFTGNYKKLQNREPGEEMILIAIVDSSQEERQTLADCITSCLKEKNTACIIRQFGGGIEFIRSQASYDIVFMDIQMQDMDGLDAARFLRIVNKDAQLIFVTHMMQMAIRGYEVNALDFIVKPVDRLTIGRVLEKAQLCIEKDRGSYFTLKTSQGLINLFTQNIYYIEVFNHDLVYHTQQGDYKTRGSLKNARAKLDSRVFIQCSRSYLVNISHVQGIHRDYLVVDGEKIPITKSCHKEMERVFAEYSKGHV